LKGFAGELERIFVCFEGYEAQLFPIFMCLSGKNTKFYIKKL
jgi:hypothetical protein